MPINSEDNLIIKKHSIERIMKKQQGQACLQYIRDEKGDIRNHFQIINLPRKEAILL